MLNISQISYYNGTDGKEDSSCRPSVLMKAIFVNIPVMLKSFIVRN